MFGALSLSFTKMSDSAHSLSSPTNCFSSTGFPSRPDVNQRSGREWWLLAVAKALSHGGDGRKGIQNHSTTARSISSSDSRLIEYKEKYEELTKLKKILDLVKANYESAKHYDVFRRYERLKKTIKHTILYVNLEVLPDITHALGGAGSILVAATTGTKKPHMVNIPECPKAELAERVHTLNKRIAFIRGQIQQLSEKYEHSKQYMVFQRYRLMKSMIKGILTDCIDLQYNQ